MDLQRRDAVIFDLDGTLTDPSEGIFRSAHHAMRRLGRPLAEDFDLRWFVGPPLATNFERLLESRDAALIERAIAAYREHFGTVGKFENRAYEGIHALLGALRAAGRCLYVCTSKPVLYARQIIEHFGMGDCFLGVYG
ncbi:MAG: HAD hydrolase-like protein, partial [Verrucomicrobiota bacterium]